jgi:hypothetical protein
MVEILWDRIPLNIQDEHVGSDLGGVGHISMGLFLLGYTYG